MRFFFVLVLIMSFSSIAIAGEKWECSDIYDTNGKILVYAESSKKSGKISVAGTYYNAQYYVEGFNRRWDFGPNADGTFKYSFIIFPDGVSNYYDFSHKRINVSPSETFKCTQD